MLMFQFYNININISLDTQYKRDINVFLFKYHLLVSLLYYYRYLIILPISQLPYKH